MSELGSNLPPPWEETAAGTGPAAHEYLMGRRRWRRSGQKCEVLRWNQRVLAASFIIFDLSLEERANGPRIQRKASSRRGSLQDLGGGGCVLPDKTPLYVSRKGSFLQINSPPSRSASRTSPRSTGGNLGVKCRMFSRRGDKKKTTTREAAIDQATDAGSS